VVIWMMQAQTGAPCGWYWWILEETWLEQLKSNLNQHLPWLKLEEKQNTRWASSWGLMLQKASNCWPDDGTMKRCSSALRVLAEKCKVWKCWLRENESFLCMMAATRVFLSRKRDEYICCLLVLMNANHGSWKCGVELVKVYFLSNFQASWHGCMYCTNLGFQTWHKPHFWTISIGQMV
jgi:hypothetical protein